MLEKFVLFMPQDGQAAPAWVLLDGEGNVKQRNMPEQDPASVLKEGMNIIVIVPAEDVLLTSAVLPKMNRSRLAQALPYAIEEQLIDDVDSLHFASGEYQLDRPIPVAVVSHAKMQEWMARLQAWNIKPDLMIPAIFALPQTSQVWNMALQTMVIVRTGDWSGFACEPENLSHLIGLVMAGSQPDLLYIRNYTSSAIASDLTLSIPCEESLLPPEKYYEDLANYAGKSPLINLLQHNYASRKNKFPRTDKVWKIVAYMAMTWAVLLFLYPLGSYFILKQKLAQTNHQIEQIYFRNFPTTKNMIAPKIRLEEKLHKLTAQVGENHLLVLLAQIGKGMQTVSSLTLKRFEFQNGQLTVELTAATSEDFTAFTDFLIAQGLQAKQQNATLVGERINGTIQVE